MTTKNCVFIATSVDGFIARKDGAIDWLNAANETVTPGEDCGYSAFIADIDVLVMGRNSYEVVLSFGAWPYGDLPVIVLSRSPIVFPDHVPNTVTHSSEAPATLCQRLATEGAHRLYIDGGVTIQRFLNAGLIDEITVTQIPILLGEGLPLFGELPTDVHLEHQTTLSYPFGFVQTKYKVVKPDVD